MKDQKQFTRRIAELVLHRGPSGTSRVCLDTDQQGFRVYDTCDENLTRPGDSWDERLSTLDEALDSMLVCSHAVIYFDILGGNTMKEEKDQAERKDSDELVQECEDCEVLTPQCELHHNAGEHEAWLCVDCGNMRDEDEGGEA